MKSYAGFVIIVLLAAYLPASEQQSCAAPPPISRASGNIFSPEQEMMLGDIVAERVERDFRLVHDEKLNAYVQTLGERLVRHVPIKLKLTFRVVDIAEVNAYTLPGGRIYVTRKLVAFVRSEDELAGVLGHEIGHAVASDPAYTESLAFKKVLGITSISDQKDLRDKYNRLIDNLGRGEMEENRKESERREMQADRVAVYALVRAGYDTEAYAQAWDRLVETKGEKGSWLSDLFGTTKYGARRLREVTKSMATMPRECMGTRPVDQSQFSIFQKAVIEYSDGLRDSTLHGLLRQVRLQPLLRPEIDAVRFSPDSKFVMAQDENGIYVLTREPFAFLFHIDAPDAHTASFTPDSRSLVFSNSSLRVEQWSMAEKRRVSVRELAMKESCMQSKLSPDGKVLACYDTNLSLLLLDVVTGNVMLEKKTFTQLGYWGMQAALNAITPETRAIEFVRVVFSSDARYLLAVGNHNGELRYFAYDLEHQQELQITKALKKVISYPFDFVGRDRLVGGGASEAVVARFPSGEVLQRVAIGDALPTAATHGDYVLVRPVKDHALGVLDLRQNHFVMANETPALDLYDEMIVDEMQSGNLALFRVGSLTPVGEVRLPDAQLTTLQAMDLSPNMDLIALSQRSRSGVWDLTTGRQVFLLHGLYGAWFADDTALFADFPKDDKTKQPRNMLRFNVKTRTGAIAYRVPDGSGSSNRDVKSKNGKDKGNDEDSPKWSGYQVGRLLCTWRPSVKRGSLEQNVDLEMSEIATGKPLWSRHFAKERPRLFWDPQSGELIFAWQLSTSAAKQETSNDPSLHSKVAALSDRETAVLLEVVSGETGKDIGRILLDTGKVSFRITDVEANRDIVKVRDDQNRIILYSLASGKQFGVLFGDESSISKDGATLAVFNGQYELALYSLPDLRKRDTLRFPERITWLRFGRDAKSLFVLTRDQTAYTLDITP